MSLKTCIVWQFRDLVIEKRVTNNLTRNLNTVCYLKLILGLQSFAGHEETIANPPECEFTHIKIGLIACNNIHTSRLPTHTQV